MFNRKLKARITDLEYRHSKSQEALFLSISKERELQSEVKRLKAELNEWRLYYSPPQVLPLKAERMVSVKFKALFDGLYRPTHFKTGPGPCGETVKWFTVTDTERELIIHQHHEDGTHKDFIYRRSDIDGRIQYDYEMVELKGEDAKREREAVKFQASLRRPRFT